MNCSSSDGGAGGRTANTNNGDDDEDDNDDEVGNNSTSSKITTMMSSSSSTGDNITTRTETDKSNNAIIGSLGLDHDDRQQQQETGLVGRERGGVRNSRKTTTTTTTTRASISAKAAKEVGNVTTAAAAAAATTTQTQLGQEAASASAAAASASAKSESSSSSHQQATTAPPSPPPPPVHVNRGDPAAEAEEEGVVVAQEAAVAAAAAAAVDALVGTVSSRTSGRTCTCVTGRPANADAAADSSSSPTNITGPNLLGASTNTANTITANTSGHSGIGGGSSSSCPSSPPNASKAYCATTTSMTKGCGGEGMSSSSSCPPASSYAKASVSLSSANSCPQQPEQLQRQQSAASSSATYTRPIIVGYAFGPKKMNTMGVVMAEASKAQIQTSHYGQFRMPPATSRRKRRRSSWGGTSTASAASIMSCASNNSYKTKEENTTNNNNDIMMKGDTRNSVVITIDGYGSDQNVNGIEQIVRNFRSASSETGTCTASTITSCDNWSTRSGSGHHVYQQQCLHPSTTTASNKSSQQQQQQSSNTAATAATTTTTPPIRVSFVPLDLDQPLQDQHGGKMDIVLHKLTEDILCLSQLSRKYPEYAHNNIGEQMLVATGEEVTGGTCTTTGLAAASTSGPSPLLPEQDRQALVRVHRLCRYSTSALIVDDPLSVRTLMSRSDIAKTLQNCLKGVKSASGIPVTTPASAVLGGGAGGDIANDHEHHNLKFPLIVKPLVAAGTKASHKMAIVLNQSGLERVLKNRHSTTASTTTSTTDAKITSNETTSAVQTTVQPEPQLCQEYSNHNALLYKVYVLGNDVRVYKRRSLPNFPTQRGIKSRYNYVEFDSQRPYPRLSDFGFLHPQNNDVRDEDAAVATEEKEPLVEGEASTTIADNQGETDHQQQQQPTAGSPPPKKKPRPSGAPTSADETTPPIPPPAKQPVVNAEEVSPIVESLKAAFGLELFGFDIIISSSQKSSAAGHDNDCCSPSTNQQQMLVVDVNYFPSYKEVPNFPALLAKYLTDRVIQSRMKMEEASSTNNT